MHAPAYMHSLYWSSSCLMGGGAMETIISVLGGSTSQFLNTGNNDHVHTCSYLGIHVGSFTRKINIPHAILHQYILRTSMYYILLKHVYDISSLIQGYIQTGESPPPRRKLENLCSVFVHMWTLNLTSQHRIMHITLS